MNKVILSEAIDFLLCEISNKYDFIYIDPPYYCQRNFKEFKDIWESVDHYMNMLNQCFKQAHRILNQMVIFVFMWTGTLHTMFV